MMEIDADEQRKHTGIPTKSNLPIQIASCTGKAAIITGTTGLKTPT
jgi:hypothetical protein